MSDPARPKSILPLVVSTIGGVYGNIGTSPLYAMRECFFGSHSVRPTHDNVLGVLSLIIYSLLVVISIKYIAIVMNASTRASEPSTEPHVECRAPVSSKKISPTP